MLFPDKYVWRLVYFVTDYVEKLVDSESFESWSDGQRPVRVGGWHKFNQKIGIRKIAREMGELVGINQLKQKTATERDGELSYLHFFHLSSLVSR